MLQSLLMGRLRQILWKIQTSRIIRAKILGILGYHYLFHLITDDEYYRSLAKDEERFATMTYRELKEKLYHDYTATNAFLKNKYDVVFPEIAQEYDIDKPGETTVIYQNNACSKIDWQGTLDLVEYLKNK